MTRIVVAAWFCVLVAALAGCGGDSGSGNGEDLLPENAAPTISAIADQTTPSGTDLGPLAFTVGDAETPAIDLVVTSSSSNSSLVSDSNIVLAGSGADRSVTITPQAGGLGTVTITLSVSDGELSASTSFTVTMVNQAPSINGLIDQSTPSGTATTAISFTINDAETAPQDLLVTVSSDHTSLVTNEDMVLSGSGSERTLTITPVAGQLGTATITVSVSDGELTVSSSFILTVTNQAPTISAIEDQSTPSGTITEAIVFTIDDVDTPVESLVVMADSSDTSLVPNGQIFLSGSGAERAVTVFPLAGQLGTVIITLTVSDGELTASSSFALTLTNQAPTISAIEDLSTASGTTTTIIPVSVADAETPVDELVVTASSSDTSLVQDEHIIIAGSGGERTLTITPVAGQLGTVTITVSVSDGGLSASSSFVLTLTNQTPSISAIADYSLPSTSVTEAIVFTVSDAETPAENLVVTASSSNPSLVPEDKIILGGSEESRTVTITPQGWETGTAEITLTVTDAQGASASTAFALMVTWGGLSEFTATYVLIDISAGPDALSYPYEQVDTVPADLLSNDTYKTDIIVLRRIPAGTFLMGSPEDELGRDANEDLHEVTLTQAFYMGVFQVTQQQWQHVMGGTNPSEYTGAKRPVESISWNDIRGGDWSGLFAGGPAANTFMRRLSEKSGVMLNLPTEAQWEYACRAGTITSLNNGTNITDASLCPNLDLLGRYGGIEGPNDTTYHMVVGSYLPNNWGLYDMHGNVMEWCLDWYTHHLGNEAVTDPLGPDEGHFNSRIMRGGNWGSSAAVCRSAYRGGLFPGSILSGSGGFRIAAHSQPEEDG